MIRNLLTHTSGLAYPDNPALSQRYRDAGISTGVRTERKTTAEMVDALAKLPLAFQPGQGMLYGMSTDVLGRVIEKVEDDKLDNVFAKRVFRPLGMKDTTFQLPKEKIVRLVGLNYLDENGKLQVLQPGQVGVMLTGIPYSADYPYDESNRYLSGGGGLCSTASDYLKFCVMLANNGEHQGKTFVTPEHIRLMTSDHAAQIEERFTRALPSTNGHRLGFGFSLFLDPKQENDPGTSYRWGGAFSTYFFIFPDQNAAAVVMLQTAFTTDFMNWSDEFRIRAAAAFVN